VNARSRSELTFSSAASSVFLPAVFLVVKYALTALWHSFLSLLYAVSLALKASVIATTFLPFSCHV